MRQAIEYLVLTLLGLHVIFACTPKHDVSNTIVEDSTNVQNISSYVHYRTISNSIDRKCREYFLVENGDTLAYSFIVRNFTYSNEYCLTISSMNSWVKMYKNKNIDYIMNGLDSCIGSLHPDYNLDSLRFVEVPLSIMGDVALEFNKVLDKERHPENYYQHHPEVLQSALCTTSLNSRVDLIMKKHGICISEMETMYGMFESREYFLRNNVVCDSSKVPQQLTLAYVRYKLEPIQ